MSTNLPDNNRPSLAEADLLAMIQDAGVLAAPRQEGRDLFVEQAVYERESQKKTRIALAISLVLILMGLPGVMEHFRQPTTNVHRQSPIVTGGSQNMMRQLSEFLPADANMQDQWTLVEAFQEKRSSDARKLRGR